MSTLEEIDAKLQELSRAEDEIDAAIAKREANISKWKEQDPEGLAKSIEQAEEEIVDARKKINTIKDQVRDLMKRKIELGRRPDRARVSDTEDPLAGRTRIATGKVISLEEMNIDEPSGQVANWTSIVMSVAVLPVMFILKITYMLTVRGRECSKDHKGTRVRFSDRDRMTSQEGIPKPLMYYISLPTAQSSILETEVTPGRFRTAVGGMCQRELRHRSLVSPVMGVIGFNAFAQLWEDMFGKLMDAEYSRDPAGNVITVEEQRRKWQIDADKKAEADKEFMEMTALLVGEGLIIPTLDDLSAPYTFATAPDRCPPQVKYMFGFAELGAFFSLCQDIRNTIIASITVGTAEEKVRKQSSFFQSYVRRTQSLGRTVDQQLVSVMMTVWGPFCIEHLNFGGDMDPNLKQKCQYLIDAKVKELSRMDPLKL